MQLIMMGTGPFAVPTFCALLDSEHQVLALVTRPTAEGRGRNKLPANPMRAEAERREIRIFAPADVNADAARRQVSSLEPDLLVVCDYGQILAPQTLSTAPKGGINLHGSLLPKYRGAAPVNWAVVQGERETGVTVIHMTPKLDAGPCLARQATAIGPDETAGELEARLAEMGPALVKDSIRQLADWDGTSPLGEPQDPALATRAPRLKKEDGRVNWSRSAEAIRNQVRGLKPWPGTFTHWDRPRREPVRLILDQVSVESPDCEDEPGSIVKSAAGQLWAATGDGVLAIHRLQPAGKRVMEVAEFLRGYPLEPGMQFV